MGSEGVTFDKSGNRLVEKLIIRNLVNDSLVEIGSWTKATNSVKFNKSISVNKEAQTVTKGLQGKKLTVVVVPKADMIVGDLTRTTLREQIVGMTVGYMFYTDKIIISKRSEIEVNDFLQFMSPMSVEVGLNILSYTPN
ncbi:hypothetical protein AC249_AIPGENE22291 [Exaiptasia diaphana]|nr:hypothetical protein AC249_AIPGENE22291 [Exaiptasia diaphana]